MPLHIIGTIPTEFESEMNVVALGSAKSAQDFAQLKLSCQKGVPRVGADCLCCPRFVGFSHLGSENTEIHCHFSHLDPVWTRMSTRETLVYITSDRSCAQADQIAEENSVRHLLVRDRGHVVGIVCRCDFVDKPKETVRSVMNRDVLAVDSAAPLGEAVSAMRLFQVGCLPVVQAGEVCGMLTRGDLRRAGIPEALLGTHLCAACGSAHGVCDSARSGGAELCLDCIDRSATRDGDLGGEG